MAWLQDGRDREPDIGLTTRLPQNQRRDHSWDSVLTISLHRLLLLCLLHLPRLVGRQRIFDIVGKLLTR